MAIKLLIAVVLVVATLELASVSSAGQATDGNQSSCNCSCCDATGYEFYRKKHGKTYNNNCAEIARRCEYRRAKLAAIDAYNAAGASETNGATYGDNDLTDLSPSEYKQRRSFRMLTGGTGGRKKRAVASPPMFLYQKTINVTSLPASWDWSAQGYVGPVMDQGYCGSCYAYSAAGAIAGQRRNFTKSYLSLSEQNLIDCSSAQGNLGCNGGNPILAYYNAYYNGLMSLVAYPDVSNKTGNSSSCMYVSAKSVVNVSSIYIIAQNDEYALQQALVKIGPISIAIDASDPTFQFYKSGIYNASSCSSTNLDHAVLLIGYGTLSNGQQYWLVRNSWGTTWGLNGNFMLPRFAGNRCGVAAYATVPLVNWASTGTTGR